MNLHKTEWNFLSLSLMKDYIFERDKLLWIFRVKIDTQKHGAFIYRLHAQFFFFGVCVCGGVKWLFLFIYSRSIFKCSVVKSENSNYINIHVRIRLSERQHKDNKFEWRISSLIDSQVKWRISQKRIVKVASQKQKMEILSFL